MSPRTLQNLDEYREVCRRYELKAPEFFNFGYDVVDQWANDRPDGTALWWIGPNGEERKLTFRQVADRSSRLAAALCSLGLSRGDQVMLNLSSVPEWWECMVGITKAGLIAVPTTTMLTQKDVVYRVQAAEVDAVITDSAGAALVDGSRQEMPGLRVRLQVGGESRPGWTAYESALDSASVGSERLQTGADEPALIYFTSGTTGPPKMVLHSHGSYGVGHRLTADFWLDLEPGTVHWNMSDTGWAKTAYAGYFGPWTAGACSFVVQQPGKFDPSRMLDILERYPVESLCAPPTVYRLLIQEDLTAFKPIALRQCRAAGEALNVEVLDRWRDETGITIREGYGQTETVLLCASIPELPVKPGSMGLPIPGHEVAIVDPDGKRLPPGQAGEIAVRIEPTRPVGLFAEYWHAPEATASHHRNGWYLTGDCAQVDDDGYIWFVARADDIITSSAYRIGPFEVENALMDHPAVAEVAVVGKPDPDRTEIVKAFVVLAEGHEANEEMVRALQEHAKQATAPYKYPREIEFLDELPKTVTGKIRRVELKDRA